MKEFTNFENAPVASYAWTAPVGATYVMVEMWGGGGGGDAGGGAGGGAYSRSVISVTPGTIYVINVGGGGEGAVPLEHGATAGADSSVRFGNTTLIFAGGGGAADAVQAGLPGEVDPSAAIHRRGSLPEFGGGAAAFGASFCPNGSDTGHGGGSFGGGNPGYVLLVW
jgi:hypothetical protein